MSYLFCSFQFHLIQHVYKTCSLGRHCAWGQKTIANQTKNGLFMQKNVWFSREVRKKQTCQMIAEKGEVQRLRNTEQEYN